jgi:hypothetical protein
MNFSHRAAKPVMKCALVVAFGALIATSAPAQTDHLWPRFSVTAGAYEISTNDKIGVEGSIEAAGREVDFSTDLGLPDNATLLAAGIDWTFANRHTLDFTYYTYDRNGSRDLGRNIEIGDQVFPIGASVEGSFKSTSIEAGYTYWFMRRETFGFGGTLGLVYLGLDAEASASFTAGGGSGTISRSASASTDLPVPMVGLSVKGQPWQRVVLYARARFLPSMSIDQYDGEAASYTVGTDVWVIDWLALGLSYDGTYYRAEIDDSSWRGSLDVENSGLHLFLRFAF